MRELTDKKIRLLFCNLILDKKINDYYVYLKGVKGKNYYLAKYINFDTFQALKRIDSFKFYFKKDKDKEFIFLEEYHKDPNKKIMVFRNLDKSTFEISRKKFFKKLLKGKIKEKFIAPWDLTIKD